MIDGAKAMYIVAPTSIMKELALGVTGGSPTMKINPTLIGAEWKARI